MCKSWQIWQKDTQVKKLLSLHVQADFVVFPPYAMLHTTINAKQRTKANKSAKTITNITLPQNKFTFNVKFGFDMNNLSSDVFAVFQIKEWVDTLKVR